MAPHQLNKIQSLTTTKLAAIIAAVILSGCATAVTSYRESCNEKRLGHTTFRVNCCGNAHTDRGTIEMYRIYKCATLTADRRYDYFVTTEMITSEHEYPAHIHGSWVEDADTGPPDRYRKYHALATIEMFNGIAPAGDRTAHNAKKVIKDFGPLVMAIQARADRHFLHMTRQKKVLTAGGCLVAIGTVVLILVGL